MSNDQSANPILKNNRVYKIPLKHSITFVFAMITLIVSGQSTKIKITKHYLNIPIGYKARMRMMGLNINGKMKREFPVQIAEDSIGYWIYIDVSEFKGQKITISCQASQHALQR